MKNSLNILFFVGFILIFGINSQAAEKVEAQELSVASIDFSKIEDLLVEIAINKPENAELKISYDAMKKASEKYMEKIQERSVKMMSGEKVDFNDLATTQNFQETATIEKKTDELAEAELILVIEKLFPERFNLIINREEAFGSSSGVLYTSIVIPDITANVKQYLLKQKVLGDNK